MDGSLLALSGFGMLLVLLIIRVPVGVAMLMVGAGGVWIERPQAVLPILAGEITNQSTNYALTIIPLFVLMGNLAGASGMSRDLFDAATKWVGHFRGGLASATVVGCAGFSALSGSSLAAALTMGRVSLPEMKRVGYDDRLSTGVIAASGTLGILIPPSAGFIIYGILTEVSIGRLFLAGVLPGVLLSLLFITTIWILVRRYPSYAPAASEPAAISERLKALGKAGSIIAIILVTIVGIYTGLFSAIEAAGIAAFLTLVVATFRKSMNLKVLGEVFSETLRTSGTLFLILFGAFVFKTFIGFTAVTTDLASWIYIQGFSGTQVVFFFLLACILFGMFLDGFAILVLTIPILQPIVEPLGVDMVWLGVLVVIVLEMGLISPPVGMNVYMVKSIAKETTLNEIFTGIWPFWIAMFVGAVAVFVVPELALLIPNAMFE